MKILVIAGNYPSPEAPQVGTFVYQLVQQFVKLGALVSVISPQKYYVRRHDRAEYGLELATVYRPKRLSFSNKRIAGIDTFHWTNFFQAKAIRNVAGKGLIQPEIVYCHFIISALNYYRAFPDSKLPVFIAVGEYYNIDTVRSHYSNEVYMAFLRRVTGFIAVSPQVQSKLLSLGVPESKISVEPNGVDRSVFRPLNKMECRKNFGLPSDKIIILFVGRFLHNKGPLRVLEAINRLPDNVVGVFIGKGPQIIEGEKVIYKGTLLHHEIPQVMSAADIFVLPTLHEGSSNVIAEAMACGLPIVSSDIPEIQFQCDPSFSILVDPLSVDEIEASIFKLIRDDAVRLKFSEAARNYSERFDLEQRAKRILNFMNDAIANQSCKGG